MLEALAPAIQRGVAQVTAHVVASEGGEEDGEAPDSQLIV
jgi:hypothetical protein